MDILWFLEIFALIGTLIGTILLLLLVLLFVKSVIEVIIESRIIEELIETTFYITKLLFWAIWDIKRFSLILIITIILL